MAKATIESGGTEYQLIKVAKTALEEISKDPEFSGLKQQDILTVLWNKVKSEPRKNLEDKKIFFKPRLSDQELYDYIVRHPEHAEWIANRYPENRQFLTLLADKTSPFYVPEVAKALESVIEIEDSKAELQELRQTLTELRNTKFVLSKEYKNLENSAEALREEITSLREKRADLERQIASFSNYGDVLKVYQFMEKIWDWTEMVIRDPNNMGYRVGVPILTLTGEDVENLSDIRAKMNSLLPALSEHMSQLKKQEEKNED